MTGEKMSDSTGDISLKQGEGKKNFKFLDIIHSRQRYYCHTVVLKEVDNMMSEK